MNMKDGPGLRDVLFVIESLQKGKPFIVLTIIIVQLVLLAFLESVYIFDGSTLLGTMTSYI